MEDNQTPDTTQTQPETPTTDISANTDNAVESDTIPHAPDAPASPQQIISAPTKRLRFRRPSKRITLIILAAVLLVCAGSAAAYVKLKKPEKSAPTTSNKPVTKSSVAVLPKQSLSGNVLLATPLKLANLNFFADLAEEFGGDCTSTPTITDYTKCPARIKATDINYYKIGTTKANQAIIVAYYPGAGDDSFQYVAIEDTPQHYKILGRLTLNLAGTGANDIISQLSSGLSSNVTLDTATDIPELSAFPDTYTVGDINLQLPALYDYPPGRFIPSLSDIRGPYFNSKVNPSDIKLAASSDDTDFYSVVAKDSANYQVREFYGVKNKIYAQSYRVNDLKTGDKPQITWSAGSTDIKPYTLRPVGCGSAYGYVVAKNIDGSSLKTIGKGLGNQPLYELPLGSALFNEIYNDDYIPSYNSDPSKPKLSQTDFQTNHGVFIAKNSFGEYMVYMRSDLIIGGGCGKPVIYLYPQSTTKVSVKVGAEMTKSVPQYPAGGWQNVLAKPDGSLTYNGQRYPNLFWEGTGFGTYPDLDSGVVVAHKDAVQTIRWQLHAQGLNAKESNDFLEFWAPRLPNTPYVRLTWFDTAQMNQLAPLSITPKPTTVLRVFLDFQGLSHTESLRPQVFHAPARHGFTAVEWGGLLRDTK